MPTSFEHPSRRQVLSGILAAGAAHLLPRDAAAGESSATQPASAAASAPFRFVHMTDIHVKQELDAAKGFAQALRAVNALVPRPDFVLTGGDLVFDVLEATPARARELFALYKHVIGENTGLRFFDTMGNHDVFGWAAKNGVTPKSPGYGKELYKESLGLPKTYYHFDHKGWRFFVLDNIQPGNAQHAYTGRLDPEQREWFAAEIKTTDPRTPIVICEHIPTVTVTPAWFTANVKDDEWRMSSSLVCTDAPDRLRLIANRNVKLWLSGHIHQRDNIVYRGTTFINDGAVCGAWWKGPHHGVSEGFGVLDLYPDGRVTHEYVTYGWTARQG